MFYALIVIYNKKIDESITYKCLKKYNKKIKIIIYDNSNEIYTEYNRKYCEINKLIYYTTYTNVGLAKAYNYVINRIEINDNNYIIMLDDDTLLNENYFNKVFEKILSDKESDILFPIVYSNDKIISPSNVSNKGRVKPIKKIDNLIIEKSTAINTAMVIKTSVFKNVTYNEKLFLDYVDHEFLMRIKKSNYKIGLVEVHIIQNFSRFQMNDLNKELFRFKIYLKDFKIYCKECDNLLLYYLNTLKYRAHQFFKYKSIKFLIIK